MAQFTENLIISLITHATPEKYPVLDALIKKLELNLFTVVSPSNIQKVEGEAFANPNLISEAVSLLETADALSLFYSEGEETFSQAIMDKIARARTRSQDEASTIIHTEVMREYFTDTTIRNFLRGNPVFVGLYTYIFATTVSI